MCELFDSKSKQHVIGIRHGEKLYEALASAEELSRALDHGDYYQIRMDARDLNYKKYFSEGDLDMPDNDYTSDNTTRLDVEEVKRLLLELPEVRAELASYKQ